MWRATLVLRVSRCTMREDTLHTNRYTLNNGCDKVRRAHYPRNNLTPRQVQQRAQFTGTLVSQIRVRCGGWRGEGKQRTMVRNNIIKTDMSGTSRGNTVRTPYNYRSKNVGGGSNINCRNDRCVMLVGLAGRLHDRNGWEGRKDE